MTAVIDTENQPFPLIIRSLGIDTHQEPTVYLRRNSHVCRAEGFSTASRVQINNDQSTIIATLHIVDNDTLLAPGEIGLSNSAANALKADALTTFGTHTRLPAQSQSALVHSTESTNSAHRSPAAAICCAAMETFISCSCIQSAAV